MMDRKKSPRLSSGGRWVVGLHSVAEVLRVRPKAVREVLIKSTWSASAQHQELMRTLEGLRLRWKPVEESKLNVIASGHQGVAVCVVEDPLWNWHRDFPSPSLLVALDGIEDPQNLGAIMRTTWLNAGQAILTPKDRAVGLTPTVCKIASGGAEHVPVVAEGPLNQSLDKLKDKGFWIFALDESGERPPWDYKLPDKLVWVIGSEGKGVRTSVLRSCDEVVHLPQVPTGSSYNASVSLAMVLAETARQWKHLDRPKTKNKEKEKEKEEKKN